MSFSKFKFLLDENVRIELYKFLKKERIDVKLSPKGLTNGKIAKLSLAERRILVTNDEDFAEYLAKEIFGVIFLKIPQNDPEALINAFSTLLKSRPLNLKGKLVILREERFEVIPLWEEKQIT